MLYISEYIEYQGLILYSKINHCILAKINFINMVT